MGVITERFIQSYMACARGEKKKFFWDLLIPVSYLTGLTVRVLDFLHRHGLSRTDEPSLPLISVGNLTYGGTNKTPFVEMLARAMTERGVRCGVVSRGYSGERSRGVLILQDGTGDREAAGDEPILLSRRLPGVPVSVARRRIDGVRALREKNIELVIADDAFQHRSLGRDADIVLIDAACPFGSGRLIPAGILRETPDALSRAHLVVITKADQTDAESFALLRKKISGFISPERIFTSRLEIHSWMVSSDESGGRLRECGTPRPGIRVVAFSAIGNPESLVCSLEQAGFIVAGERRFKDHHRYRRGELDGLCRTARELGAEALVCTEKDIYNLPSGWTGKLPLPLLVPRVEAVLDEPEKFFNALIHALRPRLVVASNGYGEDAIGVLLARRLRERFPESEVLAFPLVGRGDAYLNAGFPVCSSPSVTPSGGVVKYRLRDLWGDMRAGLLRHVSAQLRDWQRLLYGPYDCGHGHDAQDFRGTLRTPLCVGDVYLLLHTLWGSGARPLFVATAKTVHLSGHWRLERFLIRRFTLRTWTRDPESASQLNYNKPEGRAVYAGSPIMDLLGDMPVQTVPPEDPPLILLLPGSRLRAYQDVNLLLDAALLLDTERPGRFQFKMVLAPTLSREKLIASCRGWEYKNNSKSNFLEHGTIKIFLTDEPVSEASAGVALLLGLGGTANQLCAGLGIPVVSVDEKGKRVQKKLLGDAEILVPATAEALSGCALRVLNDPALYKSMSETGRRRMGKPGALADMVEYAASTLGWDLRERVFKKLIRSL